MHQPPAIIGITVKYSFFDRVRVITAKFKFKERLADEELAPKERDIGQCGLQQDRGEGKWFGPMDNGKVTHGYRAQDHQHAVDYVTVAYGPLERKEQRNNNDAQYTGHERNEIG